MIRAPDRRRRALDERLYIRRPDLLQLGAKRTFSLPHGSRLRGRLLRRNARLSYAAQNRGDWAFVVLPYGPDSVLRNVPIAGGGERVAVVQDAYRGREGAIRLLEDWTEPFDTTRFEPEELVDIGDGRILILSHLNARARGSGMEVRERLAQLITFEDGLVSEQLNWLGSWDDGLAAVGLAAA